MASRLFTITDHNSGSPAICTQHYIVQYKQEGDFGYSQLLPNPTSKNFVIKDLEDGATYRYRITRVCCNGVYADVDEGTFTTPMPVTPDDSVNKVFIDAPQKLPYYTTVVNLSSSFSESYDTVLWEKISGGTVSMPINNTESINVGGLAVDSTYGFKVTYNGQYSKTTQVQIMSVEDTRISKGSIQDVQKIDVTDPLDRTIYQDFRFLTFLGYSTLYQPTINLTKPNNLDINVSVVDGSISWLITDKGDYFEIKALEHIYVDQFSGSEVYMLEIHINDATPTTGYRYFTFEVVNPEPQVPYNNVITFVTDFID